MADSAEDNGSSPTEDSTSNPNQASQTKQLNKACEPCRASKLRCLIDPASGDGRCRRCVATRRNCIFNAPQARQRRAPRTDHRVAELERQLRDLRMKLAGQQGGDFSDLGTSESEKSTAPSSAWRFETPLTPGSWSKPKSNPQAPSDTSRDDLPSGGLQTVSPNQSGGNDLSDHQINDSATNDVISRGIISTEHAEELLQLFVTNFSPQYPFVTLPPDMRLCDLRFQRPATLLSILAATSSTSTPELNRQLNKELLTMFALRMMLEEDRTLDLVQAMVIMTVWYSPSERLENLKHYQFAHQAATMAMDIGVADENVELKEANAEPQQLDRDRRRTLLACYLLCTGISLATGRPIMLRWTPYMDASAITLLSSSEVSLNDRRLVAWVRLQRLAERAVETFFTGQSPMDMLAPATQQKVTEYIQDLDRWREGIDFELEGSLAIHYNQVRSRALCVCLYPDHGFQDFRPPFRIRHLGSKMPTPPTLTPFFARTVMNLLRTVQSALDAFVAMSPIDLLASPIITYVRTCHALSVLLMLGMASIRAGNEIAKILDQPVLKIDSYFVSMEGAVSNAIGPVGCKTPAKYLKILQRMRDWWYAQNQSPPSQQYDLRPFMSVSSKDRRQSKAVPAAQQISNDNLLAVAANTGNIGSSSASDWNQSPNSSIGVQSSTDMQFLQMDGASSDQLSDQAISPFNTWMLDIDQDPASMVIPEIDWTMFDVDELTTTNMLF